MGQNWAIVVGVNENRSLLALNYAERDAESVRDFFRELQFKRVDFFAEGADPIKADSGPPLSAEPAFGDFTNFLDRRFASPFLTPSDNLWFFFAGHGLRVGEQDYLMLKDSNPGNVDRAALKVQDLAAQLRSSGAGNVILLFDACRNTGLGSRNGTGIGLKQQGVITFYSCAPSQQSYEIEALESGAFTYALLQGLRLRGETGNCATVERLAQHLKQQVPALVAQHKGMVQNPLLALDPDSKRDAILLPQLARPGDVQALKLHALTAEVKGERRLARELWIQVLAASAADLEAVEAIERLAMAGPVVAGSVPIGPEPIGRGSAPIAAAVPIGDPVAPDPPHPLTTFRFETVALDGKGHVIDRKTLERSGFWQDLGGSVRLAMMPIPAGKFRMGSPQSETDRFDREGPQHEVTVPDFWMAQTPITQAQWQVVAKFPKIRVDLEQRPSNFKGDRRPVEQVSWWEAQEFCERLSVHTGLTYGLPSEAEWEYACRSGTQMPFHFGETITTDVANYRGTDWEGVGSGNYGKGPKGKYLEQTTDVATYPANAWGLYDMHGNVWEWCADHWHDSYKGAPIGNSPWLTDNKDAKRAQRGGSWTLIPRNCRSAYRLGNVPSYRGDSVGFRVVCRPSP
jgi:formylglycine-generating enzyme required for sulfatase activity/uncharacterized caspase-like protein